MLINIKIAIAIIPVNFQVLFKKKKTFTFICKFLSIVFYLTDNKYNIRMK